MPRALVDTTVLFAATYRRDSRHDDGLSILRGIDTADHPEAVILDTSFLRTIGGTDSAPYQTFIHYVQTTDIDLYLTPGVVEELAEQRGYISIDWVDRAETTS